MKENKSFNTEELFFEFCFSKVVKIFFPERQYKFSVWRTWMKAVVKNE
ncbi:MAG: hypothetical protein JST10_14795 [Bacteroidetes bacterium]|nr:hypothetical protein [Bacteroidota bacterium]